MASMFKDQEINALAAMLRPPEETGSELRPAQSQVVARIGPGALLEKEDEVEEGKDPQAIWKDEEIPMEHELPFLHDASDTRGRATFEMLFKNQLSTNNLFGQSKASSTKAHALLYKINFPKHQRSEIRLQVTATTLCAESTRLKLALYLPQPVESDRGKATWDDSLQVLSVSIPIARDPIYGGLLD
mmetsp:Transcript_24092/g.31342  ORF Transcript_24092/g.31342 Transcript_24092/m.31342 type:complete len:187 (+) Transcript_24092:118-678(+)